MKSSTYFHLKTKILADLHNFLHVISFRIVIPRYMLTGLKVSSLARKCVFYRLEQNAKGGSHGLFFEGLAMQKWNKPMDRAQRVDAMELWLYPWKVLLSSSRKFGVFWSWRLLWDIECINIKINCRVSKKMPKSSIFKVDILLMVAQNSNNQ